MKTLHYAIIGAIAIAAVGVLLELSTNTLSPASSKVYSAGNFSVRVIEDTSSRFLAKVENTGAPLDNAAAFAVRKGLNENCEPQGVVVANFQVRTEGGRPVPDPDSIPGNASVTLDSQQVKLNVIPTGPDFETAVYILGLKPGSIQANELIERIPIRQLNATELELYETCLQQKDIGYPLQLKLVNLQRDTQVYVTVDDSSAKYETALDIAPDAPAVSKLFWPASRSDWLSANFTQASGPAPAWGDAGELHLSVSIVSSGQVSSFEGSAQPRLVTTSLDFFEVAKGEPLPSYPKYWEIQVDLANKSIN